MPCFPSRTAPWQAPSAAAPDGLGDEGVLLRRLIIHHSSGPAISPRPPRRRRSRGPRAPRCSADRACRSERERQRRLRPGDRSVADGEWAGVTRNCRFLILDPSPTLWGVFPLPPHFPDAPRLPEETQRFVGVVGPEMFDVETANVGAHLQKANKRVGFLVFRLEELDSFVVDHMVMPCF